MGLASFAGLLNALTGSQPPLFHLLRLKQKRSKHMSTTKSTKQTKLRFAAFVRVSTEQQERKGESLPVQKDGITKAVKELKGTIVEWYGGQEHATPGYEKKEIERLLTDAQKSTKRFNAFIVYHIDRWSRDNEKSLVSARILREHGVRFFVGTTEKDLFDINVEFELGVFALMGQYHARNQKKKSLESKVARAKQGRPSCGKLPYGRTYSKETCLSGKGV